MTKNAITTFLKKVIRKPYYYVPICPFCGSAMTGRLIKLHRQVESEWAIDEALKNGELVKPIVELPEYENAFCLDCKEIWQADIQLKFLSLEEIDKQKRLRSTSEILQARYEEKTKEKDKRGPIKKYVGDL